MKKFAIFFIFFAYFSQPAMASHVVRNQYLVFDSDQEALDWVNQNRPKLKIVPLSDARYRAQTQLMAKVWTGMESIYPERTKDLPTPRLLIAEQPDPDGWVDYDFEAKLIPHMFMVTSGVTPMKLNATAGLMGHELTHLLFPDFEDAYYRVAVGEEPLGFMQSNDSEAAKDVKEWVRLTKVTGPFFIDELNQLPVKFTYDGQLHNLLVYAATSYGDRTRESCLEINTTYPDWQAKVTREYLSFVDFSIHMTAVQKVELDQLTKSYIRDFKSCLGNQKVTLEALLRGAFGSAADLTKWQSYFESFNESSNVADALLELSAQTYQKLRALEQQINSSSLRWYSHEEFADDTAVRVLASIGIASSDYADFWLELIERMQAGNKAKCLGQLANGKVPNYGLLSDPHHTPCFRVWHIRQVGRHLGQGD